MNNEVPFFLYSVASLIDRLSANYNFMLMFLKRQKVEKYGEPHMKQGFYKFSAKVFHLLFPASSRKSIHTSYTN